MIITARRGVFVLDIGGEGRHPEAWNLNPSDVRTIGSQRGELIPRHIPGRADDIPLPDGSVNRIIVERTPLPVAGLYEIVRVIAAGGTIILRHTKPPIGDAHAMACQILPGRRSHGILRLDNQIVRETRFVLAERVTQNASLPKAFARADMHDQRL